MNNNMRDTAIREIGCICCAKRGTWSACEKHHLLTTGLHGNGKRRGEKFTLGLCQYHHQGEKKVGTANAKKCYIEVGPSYTDHAREFREEFGSDDDLLKYQNEQIDIWRASFVVSWVGDLDAAL